MIRKHASLIGVIVLVLLISRTARSVELPWWVDEVIVDEPAPGQPGAVRLAGVWRDGCVPDAISSDYVASNLHLTVTQPGLNVGCPEVESPWSLTHELRADQPAYSVFGTLVTVDPSDRNIRERVAGPDRLVQIRRGRRAVFHGLGSIGDPYVSAAFDVSAAGNVVVGKNHLKPAAEGLVYSEAFAWSSRTGMRSLGFLPDGIPVGSRAHGVSANGRVVVGGSSDGEFGRSFRWDEVNNMRALPALTEVSESTAFAASGDGQYIVGVDQALTPGAFGTDSRRAYRWSATTGSLDLGVVHDRGGSAATDVSLDGQVVVGDAFEPRYEESGEERSLADVAEPFAWSQTTGMVGLGHMPYFIDIDVEFDYFRETRANAVSADGTVAVGFSSIIPDTFDLGGQVRTRAFRWTESAGIVDLGQVLGPGLVEIKAVDVSEDGSVIVGMNYYELPSPMERPPDWRPQAPFIWDEHNGMRLIRDMMDLEIGLGDAADFDQWSLETVTAISDDGRTIVGTGINALGETEAWRLVMNHDYGAGDANLDGAFGSADLVLVFQAGEYKDGVHGNSSWATGDWNGDAEFDSADLVAAFATGAYEQRPVAATVAVPEPSSALMLCLLALGGLFTRRSHPPSVLPRRTHAGADGCRDRAARLAPAPRPSGSVRKR